MQLLIHARTKVNLCTLVKGFPDILIFIYILRQYYGNRFKYQMPTIRYVLTVYSAQTTEHYNDVTWGSWRFKSQATRLLVLQLVQVMNKGIINASYYCHFVRNFHPRLAGIPHKGVIVRKMHPCIGVDETTVIFIHEKNPYENVVCVILTKCYADPNVWQIE